MFGPEGEDEADLELARLFLSPPVMEGALRRESSLERPSRPAHRRSRRTASVGGSPLSGGLPYTGRRICEYD